MAGSVNKVILIGNLGKDPEIRTMQSGDRVCEFSIATSESWKDKASGEKKEKTTWHRIKIWNQGLVTVSERYLKKGMKVYIEGSIEHGEYTDKDGIKRYTSDIVLRPYNGELTMLSSGKGSGESSQNDQQYAEHWAQENGAGGAPKQVQEFSQMEDEIPF